MTDFDFLSDDFDIDTYLANEEKREEIEQLEQLASDCNDELQYAKAEKFYQRAAELAEEINDLSLMLKERFGLASMQRMQGKYQAALEVFTWLIGVAYDPEQSRKLDEDDLWCIALTITHKFEERGESQAESHFEGQSILSRGPLVQVRHRSCELRSHLTEQSQARLETRKS